MSKEALKIGVLASGRGSNFQAIIDAKNSGALNISIKCLITDNSDAFAIKRAKQNNIEDICIVPTDDLTGDEFYTAMAKELKEKGVELVCLAGFMRIVGKPLIDAYPMRIMNIHPALLPSFKGLHGQKQALQYGTKLAGATVHFVDEGVDTGPIIVQGAVRVYDGDSEDELSKRILGLEHKIYPFAIKLFSERRIIVHNRNVTIKDINGDKDSKAYLISPPLENDMSG